MELQFGHLNKNRNGLVYKIQHVSGKVVYVGKTTKNNFINRRSQHFANGIFWHFNRSKFGEKVWISFHKKRKNINRLKEDKINKLYDYWFNKKHWTMIVIDTIENDGRDVFIEEARNSLKYGTRNGKSYWIWNEEHKNSKESKIKKYICG